MDEYFDDWPPYPVKREPSRRWLFRSVCIGICIAFAVTSLTVCVAVAAAVMLLGPAMAEIAQMITAVIVVLAALAAMVVCAFVPNLLTSPSDAALFLFSLYMCARSMV